jgi:hypothetical protein
MRYLGLNLFVIAMIFASPVRAEFRTLPGSTTEIAVKRIGCSVVVDGHVLMNGTCHHRLTSTGDVYMTLPEAATQIAVIVSRRSLEGRRVRLWMRTLDGNQHRVDDLRVVVPEGGCQRSSENEYLLICSPCWANDRVRICSWPLQANRPPGAPSELPSPSSSEVYFPPPSPTAPLSPAEQQKMERR